MISDNVIRPIVYYTNSTVGNTLIEDIKHNVAGSRGGPGYRGEGSEASDVENIDVTYTSGSGTHKFNHSNIDTETWDDILKEINEFLYGNKK